VSWGLGQIASWEYSWLDDYPSARLSRQRARDCTREAFQNQLFLQDQKRGFPRVQIGDHVLDLLNVVGLRVGERCPEDGEAQ
jgi:hypothetical protein